MQSGEGLRYRGERAAATRLEKLSNEIPVNDEVVVALVTAGNAAGVPFDLLPLE